MYFFVGDNTAQFTEAFPSAPKLMYGTSSGVYNTNSIDNDGLKIASCILRRFSSNAPATS